jgi:GDP-L-fucose synthase
MNSYSSENIINVGTGLDQTILELAQMVAQAVGYSGVIITDTSKPDGTPRKLLDVSRLSAIGWRARIDLKTGIERTCRDYAATMAAKSALI